MSKFIGVPQSSWPASQFDPKRFAVFLSTDYLVQAFNEDDGVIRLSINKAKMGINRRWVDGVSWDELQEIKNQCGYADFDAVEVYPRENDVVNVANMRHLWILPEKLSFAWRKAK